MPVDAWARASGDPADHTTFTCRVPALEHHDDACARSLDPSLQTSKFDLELCEFLLEFLAPHLGGCGLLLSDAVLVFCHVPTILPLLDIMSVSAVVRSGSHHDHDTAINFFQPLGPR